MELKVYNGEYFERGKTRYFIFALIILLVAVFSVLSNNIIWWVIVLMAAGGYLFYIIKSNDVIKLITWKKALQVDKITYPWENLSGFVLEYHLEKKKIHNIVLIEKDKQYKIYTIKDTQKNLEKFVNELNGYIPMLEKYDQSTLDKFIRKLKL